MLWFSWLVSQGWLITSSRSSAITRSMKSEVSPNISGAVIALIKCDAFDQTSFSKYISLFGTKKSVHFDAVSSELCP